MTPVKGRCFSDRIVALGPVLHQAEIVPLKFQPHSGSQPAKSPNYSCTVLINIVVRPDLKAYIDPLTAEEYQALERSLLREGCRDALVLWGDILVDGHNRHAICQKHGLPFQTLQSSQFSTMDDVHLWMIEQHLGRRSVSDFQRGVLALRKREIMTQRKAAVALPDAPIGDGAVPQAIPEGFRTREDIAKAARLSSSQVLLIEKIQKQAEPELVAALKTGAISINAAAAVASLPAEEQRQAAGGGTELLRQAAKRVRESKRQAREDLRATSVADGTQSADAGAPAKTLAQLKQRVAELEAENAILKGRLARYEA